MDRIRRRFLVLGGIFTADLVIGAIGFAWIEGYPLFDAFYMSLITITTVGYSELRGLSRAGRIFNSVYIVFGVVTVFLAIGAMAQTIIELELGRYFERRRVKRMVEKLENHYIVCGFGRVGRGAAAELKRANAPFLIVDRNEERVERAMRMGMVAVQADATRDETLHEAGIMRARGLIAALASDAENLFVILSAKTLNPMLAVSARAAEEENEAKLRRAGADVVFAPYNITGLRLAQSMLRPHVHEFLDFTTGHLDLNVRIEQVLVSQSCEYVSKSLRQTQLRQELGIIVLAIRKSDGRMMVNPPADAEICAGDHLIAMGEPDKLHALERLLTEVRA